jgi:hypothetical protein
MFTRDYSELTWNWTSNPVWGAVDSSVYVDSLLAIGSNKNGIA